MPKLLISTTIPLTIRSFLLPYADHFRKKGWQVDALTGEGQGRDELSHHFDKIWAVDWSRNPLNIKNMLGTPKRIREIVSNEGYDIVHVHTPVAAFVTRFALRDLRKNGQPKVVYTAHGFHFFKGNSPIRNGLFLTLEKTAGNWTDRLIVINREDHEASKKYRLVPEDRISLHPGIGIELSKYSAENVSDMEVISFRESLGLGKNEPLFVMIAEFNPNKRHKDLLLAFSHLSRLAEGDIHLALVGSGPLEKKMGSWRKQLGLEKNVHFLGHRYDIPTVLKAARASVLTSRREGMPRVIMESMSMGIPVIASDIRGNSDLLQNGGGLLYPAGDINALAKCMKDLAYSPEKALDMGREGTEAVKQYRIEDLLIKHEELYSDLSV